MGKKWEKGGKMMKQITQRTRQQELKIMTARVERLENMGNAVVTNPNRAYCLVCAIVRSSERVPISSYTENREVVDLFERAQQVFNQNRLIPDRDGTILSIMALKRKRTQAPEGMMC
jgi:hypothetical protein